MLDKMTRHTIIALHQSGKSARHIGKLLHVSRNTIKSVLTEGVEPAEKIKKQDNPTDDLIPIVKTLFERVNGNVVRIREILKSDYDQDISYSTLTRMVREIELRAPKVRFGEYIFEPGIEMQHDTSPHKIKLNGEIVKAQCASIIFGFSRKLFFQYYKRFTRFEAKHFLLTALEYMGGSCRRCVIDNTSVILAFGSGSNAIFTPEMVNFGRMFGFEFLAHAIMDSNRKGKIERPFSYIENNFLAGREFKDWNDVNAQSKAWCTNYANQKVKRALGQNPETAFIQEKPFLQPLPKILPPVYEHCQRTVDSLGYVNIDRNRYTVPEKLINKVVDVYKYLREIEIYYNHEKIAHHSRIIDQINMRQKTEGHHIKREYQLTAQKADQTDAALLNQNKTLDAYVAELKKRIRGRGIKPLSHLLYLKRTYPADAFMAAIARARRYGLYDLARLEALILKHIAGDFFNLSDDKE